MSWTRQAPTFPVTVTPTVILFGRHRAPQSDAVRAVMGIRGEPTTPENPANGLVWSAIIEQVDRPGSESAYVSVIDLTRKNLHSHPWSIGGGGASELKGQLDDVTERRLADITESIGFYQDTHADDVFVQMPAFVRRHRLEPYFRPQSRGDDLRDWSDLGEELILFPFRKDLTIWPEIPRLPQWSWLHALRTELWSRRVFGGQSYREANRAWFDYHQFPRQRAVTKTALAFAFIATHNHFVLDRDGKVFNRSAPVIKLKEVATEEDHLALLGLLNSSVACFWMKQVFHNKGATSDKGVLQADPEKFRFEFDGTKLLNFPIPTLKPALRSALIELTSALTGAGRQLSIGLSKDAVGTMLESRRFVDELSEVLKERDDVRRHMVRWQEELDWMVYEAYSLVHSSSTRSLAFSVKPSDMGGLDPGKRPYRQRGTESQSATLLNERDRARLNLIRSHDQLRLIEQPEYKRRWFRSAGAYDADNLDDSTILRRSLREWLNDRLESSLSALPVGLTATARFADAFRSDQAFLAAAEAYTLKSDFDVASLVETLVVEEAVPFLPVLRYKDSGLAKHVQWERTWELQRKEDAGGKVAEIPVPPKYHIGGFQEQHLLAPPREAGRAEGALHQLPGLRARRRWFAPDCVGRLGPCAAGTRARCVLHADQNRRGYRALEARAAACWPVGADPLDPPVARRSGSGVRLRTGAVLCRFRRE